jgi:diguanylate cyclase (GGDEF)-like protein
MAGPSAHQSRLARLSLRGRQHAAIAAATVPMLVATLLCVALQWYAGAAADNWRHQEQEAAMLAARSLAMASGAAGAGQAAPLAPPLQAQLRQYLHAIITSSPDPGVDSAARGASLQLMEMERGQAVPAAPLVEKLRQLNEAAGLAAEQRQARVATLGRLAQAILVLAPMLAAAAGIVLARRISRSIDDTLRNCIAFAGEIAAGNFRHGGSGARPSARARQMEAAPDSASEFDALVRAMNRIADETRTAAERDVEQSARLDVLERSWALLSACSQALVKADGEHALLQAICGHLVELGGYRTVWVGYARDDEERSVELVAHAGADLAYLSELQLSWGSDVRRQGGFGTAIHLRRRQVSNDLATDLVFRSWRNIPVPLGLAGCVALPLMDDGRAFGVLGIYTSSQQPFAESELKLLQELSEDLAFGIVSRRQAAERQQAQAELERHANFDSLTGLANLRTLEGQLGRQLAAARGRQFALLHVNLDRFRDINDALGRGAGDQVLVQAGRRLEAAAGQDALVARIGGDEFLVLLGPSDGTTQATEAAKRICAALNEPLADIQPPMRPQASVGISLYPDDGKDGAALQRHANLAMQQAKREGGNTYRYYASDLNVRMAARFVMEAELGGALERNEMFMHYQPQCSLLNGAIIGAEALIRWRHPSRGIVSPGEFIRVAEETGLVLPIGAWTINHVCAQLRAWQAAGLAVPTVSVNLSARQFQQAGLVDTVRRALADHDVPGPALELEVTESAMMHDVEGAVETLRQLKQLGVKIALDDFGTGYSSLNYLKRLPIDHLKIDQSFVRDIATAPDDAIICNAIIGLAHNLQVSVVAEGVETDEQLAFLKRRKCDAMQGFLFSKAVSPEAFAQLVAAKKSQAMPASGEAQTTVLLLDDEADILRALNRTLRPDGYRILAATNADDAFKLLALNEVHVVVSDQRMPEVTGTEFLGKVKLMYPDTVRILLTGYADMQSVIDAINQGAVYRYFTKPWDNDELKACVAAAARSRDAAAAAGPG